MPAEIELPEALGDHDKARRFGQAGRRRFDDRFAPDSMVAGYD